MPGATCHSEPVVRSVEVRSGSGGILRTSPRRDSVRAADGFDDPRSRCGSQRGCQALPITGRRDAPYPTCRRTEPGKRDGPRARSTPENQWERPTDSRYVGALMLIAVGPGSALIAHPFSVRCFRRTVGLWTALAFSCASSPAPSGKAVPAVNSNVWWAPSIGLESLAAIDGRLQEPFVDEYDVERISSKSAPADRQVVQGTQRIENPPGEPSHQA